LLLVFGGVFAAAAFGFVATALFAHIEEELLVGLRSALSEFESIGVRWSKWLGRQLLRSSVRIYVGHLAPEGRSPDLESQLLLIN
jgi:hypothetical protein